MAHAFQHGSSWSEAPAVRAVEATRPLVWLRAGWHDLARLGARSLVYGAAAAGAGVLLLALAWRALIAAFMVIGFATFMLGMVCCSPGSATRAGAPTGTWSNSRQGPPRPARSHQCNAAVRRGV